MKISYFYLAVLIAAFTTICNAASVQNTTTAIAKTFHATVLYIII